MKKDQKKLSLMKNEILSHENTSNRLTVSDKEKLFIQYCNGTKKLVEMSKELNMAHGSFMQMITRDGWPKRKRAIIEAVRNDTDEQIRISKKNEAIAGLLIKKLNTKRIIKEYEAYQNKGRAPSYLGTNTSEYKDNFHLANILLEGEKININLTGKVKHDVRNYSPEQIDRVLDVLLEQKNIPDSPLENE